MCLQDSKCNGLFCSASFPTQVWLILLWVYTGTQVPSQVLVELAIEEVKVALR